MSDRELKVISIPEGLDKERVDVALSRLLGLSRSTIVDLIAAGEIKRNGKIVMKSDRIATDDMMDILMPAAKRAPALTPTPIAGMKVIFNDDHIIVIEKPAGVAAHPSPGWQGATVIGGIVAAGYNVATSGAPERQGVVHRLDVGTTGLMVVAKDERAYSGLKEQFRDRTVTKVYHALIQGHMDPDRKSTRLNSSHG